eukprot:6196115-Pleurochrysis_carterae.AAC.4
MHSVSLAPGLSIISCSSSRMKVSALHTEATTAKTHLEAMYFVVEVAVDAGGGVRLEGEWRHARVGVGRHPGDAGGRREDLSKQRDE